ncbi:MAG TPA: GAF domain-containing protein, partial [Rhodanobacter sp.]
MVGEADHGTGWFQRIAPAHVASDMLDLYPERLPFSVAHLSFWQGMPQLEADIRHAPDLEMFRQIYLQHGITSAIAVPVLKFGTVQAALVIRSRHASFFSPRMIELLQQAAASIGLGLEAHEQRVLLLQAVQDEARQRHTLRLLSEMIKVVTRSADEQVLLTDACHVTRRIGNYQFAWIGLLENDSSPILRLCAQEGLAHEPRADGRLDLADASHAGNAAVIAMQTGQPQVRHPRFSGHLDWPLEAEIPDLRAILALPLRVDGAIVGAFVIGAVGIDVFAPAEVKVFSEMATELGLGIQMQRARAARLAAEHDLRFNLQHFRTILTNQHAGILVMSEDGTVKFANEAFCALFGLSETPNELENTPSAAIHACMQQA